MASKKHGRAFTKESLIADGWVEGEHFYVNHSGTVISLIENEDRECKVCHQHYTKNYFLSALHKSCRRCYKRAQDGVELGSPEALARDMSANERKKADGSEMNSAEARAAAVAAHDKLLATRLLARRRLIHFIEAFHPGYKAGWVHKDICRRLERFMANVVLGRSPRLLIFCPPRLGKSLIASQYFPAWLLGHHPEYEIIAASYNISLPIGFSRRIRETVRDPVYAAMFGSTRLSDESQAVEAWRTTEGGGYTAAGVGTGITGKGAHVLIIDDPVKDQEAADSALIRDATWDWYLSTAYTRVAPGGGILGIQTRWNDDDWSGRIIVAMQTGEGEQFEIASYPAINELGDEYLLEDDTVLQVPPDAPVPENATLIRPHGSALHPDRYDLDHLSRIKKNFQASGNIRMWSALYQQNPVPDEGAFFRKEMFRYYSYDVHPGSMNVYQAWDFSITEKNTSDWIVGACFGQDEYDNVYELDMIRFKVDEDSFILADAIIDFYQKWNPWLVGFEDGQIWKGMKAVLLRRMAERGAIINHELLTPLTDKLVRAGPLRGRMQLGKFYMRQEARYRQDVDQELLRFPAGKHDDIVDAYSWCMRLVLAHTAPKKVEPKKLPSWKDKLFRTIKGESHMAA